MTTTPIRQLSNPRAEAIFVRSGLADALRPVVSAEARTIMNNINCRFSDAVDSACQAVANGHRLASRIAQALLDDLRTVAR